MEEKDLSIAQMKQMQANLYEQNKEYWKDMYPQASKNHLLYMIEEIGECIAIIKKKGIDQIMEEPSVRERFVEEFADVLMYYTEVLNRLEISSEELGNTYRNKYQKNAQRDFKEEYKNKIV